MHDGCETPSTGLTGRVLAERGPLEAPSPSAIPATRQLLEVGQRLTHETVELPEYLPVRPGTPTVLRDSGEPCCCSVGNINSVTHPHLNLEEEQGAEGAAN